MTEIETRLTNLEQNFTYQDDLVSKLNLMVSNQETKIEVLLEQVRSLKEMAGAAVSKDEAPPHY